MHEPHHDDTEPTTTAPPEPAGSISPARSIAPAGSAEQPGSAEPEQAPATPDGPRRLPPRDPDQVAEELLRRRYAVGRKAAARTGLAVAVLAVLALLTGIGLQQAYATAPPPAHRPGAADAPLPPRTPLAGPAASGPPATAEGAAPATLDADGVIHHTDGRAVRIPLPAGTRAVDAVRVAAGWVVRTMTGAPLAMHGTVFLGDDGRLRDFAPVLAGAQTAIRADGRAMAAYLHPHLYVFELPSGRELTRLDVRTAARGNQVHDLWLTADRLLISWGVLEGAHPGAVTGLVAYDLTTSTATVSPDLVLGDVAADGTALVLDGASCIRVARLGRTGPRAQARACLPGRTVLRAALSPDGALVALSLGTPDVPAREGRLALFRTADLAAGRISEVAGHDGRLRVVGWSGRTRLLAVDDGREPLDEVLTCAAAGCAPLPLDGVRVAVVPAHLP
ncbi:hypothetical protein CS0771_18410 [Catellatospora sp. IY07-71]|uniref:hypothetical protein n=1 Tax=Catellatospora sp. IY07-71 TaxID=2728827 RepID=UPI001BB2EFFD|nr:hypothetical protein [Catellatospora sp. IY07-71]BCJ72297.1 hypothetical protein CS0771_18410 [Catellatospora sp. IY07-71]